MKVDRGRLVAGAIGVLLGVAATLGVVAYRNGALARRCNEDARKISILLADSATPEQIEDLERELLGSGDVESLEYVSPEEALEELRERFDGRQVERIGGLPTASIEVVAADYDATYRLRAMSSPVVAQVRSGQGDEIAVRCALNDYPPVRGVDI